MSLKIDFYLIVFQNLLQLELFKVVLMREQSKGNEMKINIQIIYTLPCQVKQKFGRQEPSNNFQSWVKIYRLLWQRVDL